MNGVIYYISLPFIYLLSWSPAWLLYGISDVLFFVLYRLVGYRKKVVHNNLKNSFPEKSEQELLKIQKEFYQYLCDLILETLKTITMSQKYVHQHVKFMNKELIEGLYDRGKSIFIVMGHYGNWELAGPCFSLNLRHQLNVVYKPLSNPYFERLFAKTRTKFNTQIIPMKNTLRAVASNKKTLSATALIADQTPSDWKTGFWLNFLNQETLVFTGPEKMAKMFDYPVVYIKVDRVKRGHYEIKPTLLFDGPKETHEEQITRVFNKTLEEDIKRQPETWLWSHRRWKHKKPN